MSEEYCKFCYEADPEAGKHEVKYHCDSCDEGCCAECANNLAYGDDDFVTFCPDCHGD